MRTILYTSLSLNGLVIVQEGRTTPPPMEVYQDFLSRVQAAGNLILGRASAEPLLANADVLKMFAPAEIYVLSGKLPSDRPEVVQTPEEALRRIELKGQEVALIGGGAKVYDSFLSRGLVDELVINLSPEITTKGLRLTGEQSLDRHYQVVSVRRLTDQITQLHYARN